MIQFKDLLEDVYTSEYKIKQYVDPATGETKTRKIRPHRIEFKNSKMQAEPAQPKQVEEENNMFENVDALIVEVLTKDASAGEWIHDFIRSDNPKFAGKSPAKRKEMALAAYYAKQRNEEVEETDTSEKTEMAETQLHFIKYAAEEILEYIKMGGEIEEWYQNKLSKVQSELESLHSYVEGESRRTGMKEDITESEKEMTNKKSFKSFMKKPSDCQETMGVQGYAGAAPVTQVLSKEEKEKEKSTGSWKVETPWKKVDPKKNPEGKVHNLAGMALKKTKELAKEEMEELKGDQHKIDKNKNGKIDSHDFKLLRKEEAEDLEEGYVVRYNNPKSEKHGGEKHFDNEDSAKKHADHGNSVDKIGGKYTVHKTNEKGHDIKEQAPVAPVPGQKFKDHAVMVNGKQRVVVARKNIGNYSKEEGWREVAPGTKIKESVDETGTLPTTQISYQEFVMMLEGQTIQVRPGVTRHIGTYGTAKGAKYGNTDYERDTLDAKDDDKKQEVVPTTKRGRGRPAGAKSGANQKVTGGKSEKNYADYTGYKLHLPNTNK